LQELEGLDDAALRDLYEMRADEHRAAAGREDFSGALDSLRASLHPGG
jgi:hypothetical protein